MNTGLYVDGYTHRHIERTADDSGGSRDTRGVRDK